MPVKSFNIGWLGGIPTHPLRKCKFKVSLLVPRAWKLPLRALVIPRFPSPRPCLRIPLGKIVNYAQRHRVLPVNELLDTGAQRGRPYAILVKHFETL